MDINVLKANKNSKKFPKGHVIFREGETTGEEMYVILEGHVGVYKGHGTPAEQQIAKHGVGNFFGESTMLLLKGRTVTTVALDDVLLYVVERQAAFAFFGEQPQLTYLIMKTMCSRLEEAKVALGRANMPSGVTTGAQQESLFEQKAEEQVSTNAQGVAGATPAAPPVTPVPLPAFIGDEPPPGFAMPPAEPVSNAPSALKEVSADLFPEGHKPYDLEREPAAAELIYKKAFKCPICEKSFQAYAVRDSRLKLINRDKDFRNHYNGIDTIYYEIVTCPECYYSNFMAAYAKPVIARFKENAPQITAFKPQIGLDLIEDRSINAVFAGYYLALKGAPLFYKEPEMTVARIWIRLMWLYHDVSDYEMERMAAENAQKTYMAAFEKTDAGPDAVQQMCVMMGELSLIVKDIQNAKIFFVKARNHRGGSKTMATMAEDGIETIRKIESGQIRL